ncbi:MAG: hypothetical protein A3G93_07080 [Nitrospinae bacterium RIFCSPLOWO2_12_FULL_45_22]|nr:MAG: hypothetical protein A3G93_07080 [Nitrospinae bacterium RIFCSPLOWO2_12_FULL_45_22]
MTRKNPFAQYEEWGEEKVRHLLATGRIQPGSESHNKMSSWLKLLDDKRTVVQAVRAETREEETLSISRKALQASEEANSIASKARFEARQANIIAIIAMILSGIIAIIATSDKLILFLQGLGIVSL